MKLYFKKKDQTVKCPISDLLVDLSFNLTDEHMGDSYLIPKSLRWVKPVTIELTIPLQKDMQFDDLMVFDGTSITVYTEMAGRTFSIDVDNRLGSINPTENGLQVDVLLTLYKLTPTTELMIPLSVLTALVVEQQIVTLPPKLQHTLVRAGILGKDVILSPEVPLYKLLS